ncbi:hypothetical protein AB0K34_23525 [Actinomadura sp. NPDC049382]|uniref:hypothetical protein n=1 Tax=Actinomadura sp. NPDC049382 TaxID=3158220 RepID=UPI003425E392
MSFDQPRETDAESASFSGLSVAEARLAALGAHLRAHRLVVELTSTGLKVRNLDAPGCCDENPVLSDKITCRPFDRDGGHLWFFDSSGHPITEAERIVDAVVWVKGRLADRNGLPAAEGTL